MKSNSLALAAVAAGALLLSGCSGSSDSNAAAGTDNTGTGAPAPTTSVPTTPAGTPTGTTSTGPGSPPISLAAVTGTSTRLTVDQGFLRTLKTVGVTLAPVGGAKTDTAGDRTTYVFPVIGGSARTAATGEDRFSGSVRHAGGLRLSGLGRSVTIDRLVLDGSSDQLTGEVSGRRVPLLPLATGAAQVSASGKQIRLDEGAVTLLPGSVQALADQLGLPALPRVPLGSLTSTITGG